MCGALAVPDQAYTKVYVDLSLFTKDNSFGRISGDMIFPSIPNVGDVVPFNHKGSCGEDELMGTVSIESIIRDKTENMLLLSDVYVNTKNEAFRVARFLENVLGLFADIYDEADLRAYVDQELNRKS